MTNLTEINVTWSTIKSFVQTRSVPLQYVEDQQNYYLAAADGFFQLSCFIPQTTPPSADQTDFETNFKPTANTTPQAPVVTAMEVNDKDLKLASSGVVALSTTAVENIIYLKVPGTYGVDDGRWAAGGYALIDVWDLNDRVKVYVEDKDRVLCAANGLPTDGTGDATMQASGYPQYPIVKSYTDDEQPEGNQGWHFWPLSKGTSAVGETEVEPIGGYGHIPAGLYMKFVLEHPSLAAANAVVDIFWGKKE